MQIVVHCVALQRIMKTHRWPRGGSWRGEGGDKCLCLPPLLAPGELLVVRECKNCQHFYFYIHWKPIWMASQAVKDGYPIKLSPKVSTRFQRNPIFHRSQEYLENHSLSLLFPLFYSYWKNKFRTNFMSYWFWGKRWNNIFQQLLLKVAICIFSLRKCEHAHKNEHQA